MSSGDIFDHEAKVLEAAEELVSQGGATPADHEKLGAEYRKLLRTTKRIIKLSDKSEQRLTALSKEAQDTNKQLEGLSNQLSKYLSPQLYKSIFTGNKAVARTSSRKKLTVFFSDLCGFTNIAENLESEDVTDMLNLYLETMTQIALNYGATIDKYIGDGIMLFFGDPESAGIKEDAVNCVKMAQEMQESLHGLQDNWHQYGLQSPLQMRIGIATGFCTVGNFGSETRLEYTAIGSGVNTAARLEAAAENGEILMSFDTYALVSDQIPCQELATVNLKGIGPVRTFQPLQNIEDIQSSISLEVGTSSLNANLSALSAEDLGKFEDSLLRAIEKVKGTRDDMSKQASLL